MYMCIRDFPDDRSELSEESTELLDGKNTYEICMYLYLYVYICMCIRDLPDDRSELSEESTGLLSGVYMKYVSMFM
jgi:hypothetical protein